jgi:hypothetical protein
MSIALVACKLVFHLKTTGFQGHVKDHVTLLFTVHWHHPNPTSMITFFIGDMLNAKMKCIKHRGFFNVKLGMGALKICKAIQ